MAILNNNPLIGSGGQQGYSINNSLRFRSSASAYLNRTPASAGNRKTYTYSFWAKYSTGSSDATFFSTYGGSSGQFFSIGFAAGGTAFDIDEFNGSARNFRLTTTQVFRDPSAWYHFVVAIDTTQATSSNRVKIYVNGNQVTAFSSATYPSQNFDTYVNTTQATNIGRRVDIPGLYLDGYLADVNFIDGSAKTPSDFGETDTTTGVWKPKAYTGTYGTNGFYLKFSDIATTSGSNAGLGKDFSGNSNYWTTNNISVTSGTTYDAMTDSPTNTSATVANYPTLNPLSNTSTLTEANLSASNILLAGTTMATPSTGKWYFEYTQTTSIPSGSLWVGVSSNTNAIADNQLQGYAYASDGRKVAYNSYTSGYGATWTNGDVIGCALDLDNQTITFYKNNVSQGTAFTSITAQPYVFALSAGGVASTKGGSINCGQRPFAYTPPTGFNRLNTYNLPDSTIKKGNSYMDATLYTGNNTGQTITNAGSFRPDFLWIKVRSNTYDNTLADSVRGVSAFLASNTTAAEGTNSELTSFNSNGFTLGATGSMARNVSGQTYVAWQWQAGQGSTSSNTSGSITSTVSVNTTAGFSVVTYTGTGSTKTFGHGLGVTPAMFIVKSRSQTGENWVTWHKSFSNTAQGNMALNTTDAVSNSASVWGNTAPTSTLITVGNAAVNNNTSTYVCYAWAEIAGFSKFGSYTGNGSTDGPFVYTGFRPKFILAKDASVAGQEWTIYDTSRSTYNQAGNMLSPTLSTAETVWAGAYDILSNGFKLRTTDNRENRSASTFIYAAFAESPFKNSLAR